MQKWDFDVEVIDAGHGGQDPGAIGIGNIKEKEFLERRLSLISE